MSHAEFAGITAHSILTEPTDSAEFTAEHRRITKTPGGAPLMPPTAAWSRGKPGHKPPPLFKAACVRAFRTTSTGPPCGPYQRCTAERLDPRMPSVRLRYASWLRCELRGLRQLRCL